MLHICFERAPFLHSTGFQIRPKNALNILPPQTCHEYSILLIHAIFNNMNFFHDVFFSLPGPILSQSAPNPLPLRSNTQPNMMSTCSYPAQNILNLFPNCSLPSFRRGHSGPKSMSTLHQSKLSQIIKSLNIIYGSVFGPDSLFNTQSHVLK